MFSNKDWWLIVAGAAVLFAICYVEDRYAAEHKCTVARVGGFTPAMQLTATQGVQPTLIYTPTEYSCAGDK